MPKFQKVLITILLSLVLSVASLAPAFALAYVSNLKILGTVAVGNELTISFGTSTCLASATEIKRSAKWRLDTQDGTLLGTGAKYQIKAADTGHKIVVEIACSYRNSNGQQPTFLVRYLSQETKIIPSAEHPNCPNLAMVGSTQVGSTLTVGVPGHPNDPVFGCQPAATSVTYVWKRAGKVISGQSTNTYTLQAADLGKIVTANVTVGAFAYQSHTYVFNTSSTVTLPPISTTGAPRATFFPPRSIACSTGDWDVPPTSYKYQWYQNGVALRGANKSTLSLPDSAGGGQLSCTVQALKKGFETGAASSQPISIPLYQFLLAPAPIITGTPFVHSTLSISLGVWSPLPQFQYQWMKNGSAISGATKSTYKLSENDFQSQITVRVAALKSNFVSTIRSSSGVEVSKTLIPKRATPVVQIASGKTYKVGSVLKISLGTWTPGTTFETYWLCDGLYVLNAEGTANASGLTLKLTEAQVGCRITAKVTAYIAGYLDSVFDTNPSPVVTR